MKERPISFISMMMGMQEFWERTRVGTDGTMEKQNDPEHIIRRGIIGEAEEALEALSHGAMGEAVEETIDVFIFLCSLWNHLGVEANQVEDEAVRKMATNFEKYSTDNFKGRTLKEGIAHSREQWARKHSLLGDNS